MCANSSHNYENATMYYCTNSACDDRKPIPGRAEDLPLTIRAGCDRCEMITRHHQEGV